MMVCYSNTTTARLEAYGRARGLEGFGVLKSPDNSAGVFFCVRLDGVTLTRWISLGWTRADAEAAIERLAAERPVTPSATGYSYTV
jgi:hypothetical protein